MKDLKRDNREIGEYDGYSIPEFDSNITEEERKRKIEEADARLKQLAEEWEKS